MLRKWVGLLFTSDFLCSFTQVKVKVVCLTEWTFLHLIQFYYTHLKMLMWRWNLALMQLARNSLFKLAVSSIQCLQSDWDCSSKVTLCICFFVYIKFQEKFIKIQLTPWIRPISSSQIYQHQVNYKHINDFK